MPRRTNDQKLSDRALTAEMYLQGHTQVDIAQKVGISTGQVCIDLKIIRDQWAASAILNINEAKNRELARINLIEKEAWVDFYGSREDAEGSEQTEGSGPQGLTSASKIWSKGRLGDHQYLRVVLDCTKQRRAILGLDQPTQHHHAYSEPSGEQAAVAALSDSELDRLRRSLKRNSGKGGT